ncbi:hypothetical protein V6N13_063790 [Hibiscus sabdariffa]
MPLYAPLRRNQMQSSRWLLEDTISGIQQFGIYKSSFPLISQVTSISHNSGPTFPPNHASRDCVTPVELEARFLPRLRSSAPVHMGLGINSDLGLGPIVDTGTRSLQDIDSSNSMDITEGEDTPLN